MYEWNKDLLYRAVDLQLKAAKKGRRIKFDFPYRGEHVLIDEVTMWDYKKEIQHMLKTANTNEELSAMLGKLEKKLSRDLAHPGTKSSSYETLQSHYRKEEEESQDGRRTQG